MMIEYVILADAAEVVNGKLYMLGGGWTQLNFPQYPAPGRLAIAISLLADPTEIGTSQTFSIAILNPTGAPVMPPIQGEVQVGPPADPTLQSRAMLAINGNVQIPMPGTYQIVVTAGATERRELVFNARLAVSMQ